MVHGRGLTPLYNKNTQQTEVRNPEVKPTETVHEVAAGGNRTGNGGIRADPRVRRDGGHYGTWFSGYGHIEFLRNSQRDVRLAVLDPSNFNFINDEEKNKKGG